MIYTKFTVTSCHTDVRMYHVFVMFSTSTAKMLLGVVARRMTLSGGGTLQHVSPECWHSRVLRFPGACVKDVELFKTAKCEKKVLIWRHIIRPGHRLWICVSQLNNMCTRVLRNSQCVWSLNVLHRGYLDVRHYHQLRNRLESFKVGIMMGYFFTSTICHVYGDNPTRNHIHRQGWRN